jgi:hypothetical protein
MGPPVDRRGASSKVLHLTLLRTLRRSAGYTREDQRLIESASDVTLAAYRLFRRLAEGARDPTVREAFEIFAQLQRMQMITLRTKLNQASQRGEEPKL